MSQETKEFGLSAEEIKFFNDKKVLIVDPKKSLRSTLKKLLKDLGVNIANIEFAEGSFEENAAVLIDMKPELVFSPLHYTRKSAIDMLNVHKREVSDRLNAAFFVISPSNSLSQASLILDHEIDGCIAEPITAVSIKSTIIEALKPKINRTSFDEAFEKLRYQLTQQTASVSEDQIEELAKRHDASLDKIYYLHALRCSKQNQYDQAINWLTQALQLAPQVYRYLKLLGECAQLSRSWELAYDTQQKILQTYPLNPEIIPELIKLSVVNEKYDDIFKYLKIFESLEEKSELVEKYMAAGLTLCGRFLLQRGEREHGLKILDKAADLNYSTLEVVKNLVHLYMEQKVFTKAMILIEKYREKYKKDSNFLLLEIEVLGQSKKTLPKALKIGLELISKGFKNEEIYEHVIRLSVQLERNQQFIQELANDASRLFPHRSDDFAQLSKKSLI